VAALDTVEISIKIDKRLYGEFTRMLNELGLDKNEIIAKMIEEILLRKQRTRTSKIRGIVKSKLSLKYQEQAYFVS